MYATVRRYEGVTDPAEVARRVREDFVPLISEIDGFVAYYWVDARQRRDGLHHRVQGSGRSGSLE
jgi:hypothetical protein